MSRKVNYRHNDKDISVNWTVEETNQKCLRCGHGAEKHFLYITIKHHNLSDETKSLCVMHILIHSFNTILFI